MCVLSPIYQCLYMAGMVGYTKTEVVQEDMDDVIEGVREAEYFIGE